MKSYSLVIILLAYVSLTLAYAKTTKQPKSFTVDNAVNSPQSSVLHPKNEKPVGKFRDSNHNRKRIRELTIENIKNNIIWHLGRDGVEKKMLNVVLSDVDMEAITTRSQKCMKNLTQKLRKYYKEASDEFISKCLTIFPFCDENDQKSKKSTTFYFNVSNILAMRLNGDVTRLVTFKLNVRFRDNMDKKKMQKRYRKPLYMVIYGTRKHGRNSTEPIKVLKKVKFNFSKQEWLKISLKKEMRKEKKKRSSDKNNDHSHNNNHFYNNNHSHNNNLYRGIVLSVVDSKNVPIDIREIFYNHRCHPGNSLETRNFFSLPHLEVNMFSKKHTKTLVGVRIVPVSLKQVDISKVGLYGQKRESGD